MTTNQSYQHDHTADLIMVLELAVINKLAFSYVLEPTTLRVLKKMLLIRLLQKLAGAGTAAYILPKSIDPSFEPMPYLALACASCLNKSTIC